jgi:hypothetical protein
MFKKTALIAAVGMAISATAQAEYRFEAGAAITGGDVSSLGIGGTYYLDSVDDSKGPLGEAAFMSRASSISLSGSDGETDADDIEDLEVWSVSADARLVFGEGGWIADLGYLYSEPELADGPGNIDTDINAGTVGFGKYLFENTTLVASYTYIDIEAETDDGVELFDSDYDAYRLDVDHLFQFGDNGGLKLHAAYGLVDLDDNDDIDIYELDATWYICRNLGIGAAIRNTEQDGQEIEEYGVSGEYFINEQVAFSVSYFEGEFDDTNFETDSFMVGITARF